MAESAAPHEPFPDPLRVEFHLLDRQIVDLDGRKIGKVDDVEFNVDPDGTVTIAALLVGQTVLGTRLGGRFGTWVAALARRFSPDADPQPLRIGFEHVHSITSEIRLSIRRELLAVPPLEDWLRQHLIGRIPGAGDAGQ